MRCSVRLSGIVAVIMVLAGLACAGSAEAAALTLEVAAGDWDREGTVVAAEVPEGMRGQRVALARADTGKAVPVQWEGGGKGRLVWILGEKLAAGQVRRYRLSAGGGETEEAVKVEDDGKHLNVSVGGKPVLVYNHAVVPSPDPKQPYYARSGHIHPVYSPSGQVVTDDFNPDHMHQHGIMFAWTKSTFEGRPSNCWDQKGGQGTVEHVAVEAAGGGPVFGHFTARLRHVNLNGPEGRKPILDETWDVRVYNFSDHFLFDLTSSQTCAGTSPLVVEEYHYGGMAIRGSAAWPAKSRADFLTSEGKTRADGNHTRPRWCDIYGPVDGRMAGVCILGHPTNFRFPQHVRLHPSMPYFCFSPAVLGAFPIEPGKPPYVSQYRFYVHDGRPEPEVAERLWQDYAEPPEVRVVSQ